MFFLLFWVFPKVFRKRTKLLRKPQIQKNTKENQRKHKKPSGKPKKVFKGFRPSLGYVFLSFPEGFWKTQLLRKPKIQKKTKETTKNFRGNQKTKFLKVSDPPLDMDLFCLLLLVFPKVFKKQQKP